ncbi:hypothetical protein [Aerococcus urinaeequi]|uniref:hypothetical protein n=1 Tax=Aerococcus urinaeequi TaxID=51665 RepID=UPI0036721766
MTDNIKPEHYRKGEIDLYEAFSQIFPHNEYRAGMQMIAMRYMFRDKNDRVEDIGKAMETLERLKEKEIEYKGKQVKSKDEVIDDAVEFMRKHKREHDIKTPEAAIVDMLEAFNDVDTSEAIHKQDDQERVSLLKNLLNKGFEYVARDKDGVLSVYDGSPVKVEEMGCWDFYVVFDSETIQNDNLPEVKWTDDEPTKISKLLATYENGGENGN